MRTAVEPSDWTCLDPWWSAYAKTRPLVRSSASPQAFDRARLANSWTDLDPWWQAFAESPLRIRSPTPWRAFDRPRLTSSWGELDPWWAVYTETGHATAGKIVDLLNQSNDEWQQSDAPFDTDPLAADLTSDRFQRGSTAAG